MGTSLFRQLSREEYDKLTLEQRIAYMRDLMDDLRAKLKETQRQVEQTKKLLRKPD